MKVKNIKSFIDFYSSMGISLEIERIDAPGEHMNIDTPGDLEALR